MFHGASSLFIEFFRASWPGTSDLDLIQGERQYFRYLIIAKAFDLAQLDDHPLILRERIHTFSYPLSYFLSHHFS